MDTNTAPSPDPDTICAILVALYHPAVRIPIPRTYQPLVFGKKDFRPFNIGALNLGELVCSLQTSSHDSNVLSYQRPSSSIF